MESQEKESKAFSASSKVPFNDAWLFIVKVGLAAHKYGSTSARLESFLTSLSKEMGYPGVFKSTPVELTFAMTESPGSPQRIEILSVPAPDIALDKLARLGEVLNEIKSGNLSLADADKRIDAIDEISLPWGKFPTMLGYVFTGLGIAPLLGAGWTDTIIATLFSAFVYGMVLISARLGRPFVAWIPLSTALIVSFLTTLLKSWIPELNMVLVIVSAVAIILPGYSISLGAGELVAQKVLSGISNLMGGLITLFKQIAGAVLGVGFANLFVSVGIGIAQAPVSQFYTQLLFPFLLVGLALAFQTSKRDLPWVILVSGLAYLGVLYGSHLLNGNLGNLVGTIVAVVLSNLWARKTSRPTSIVLIPAIVMLVSGTIGFRGLASIAVGDLALGTQQFFQMFLVAMTVVAGIMIGYTIIQPEESL